eukprot:COSAG03_NODE_1646_length_3720_cov_9.610329_1_plen_130_part_00
MLPTCCLEQALEEWHEQRIVRWTSPIGFVEVIDIAKSARAAASPTPAGGDAEDASHAVVHRPPSMSRKLSEREKERERERERKREGVAPFKVGDAVEVLDGTMEWFLAKIIELPTEPPPPPQRRQRRPP